MEAIQKSILGIGDKLSGAYKEAASLSGGVDITVLDMEVIQKDILGIEIIKQKQEYITIYEAIYSYFF